MQLAPYTRAGSNQGPQARAEEAVRVAAEVSPAPEESNFQSLTASESVLRGQIGKLTRLVRELRDKVARMPQERDNNVEDVFLESDGLQLPLDSATLEL